jgi:hypothetical protein
MQRKNTKNLISRKTNQRKRLAIFVSCFALLGVLFVSLSGAETVRGTAEGAFNADCFFSHRAADDPIVYPGQPGAAHMHDFIGSKTLNANSTNASLLNAPTNCDRYGSNGHKDADKSAYWVPTLYVNGSPVSPGKISAYYNAGYRDYTKIRSFPVGYRIIAGVAQGNSSDAVGKVYTWGCNGNEVAAGTFTSAPTCGSMILLSISFPDCWDGVNLDSANHRSHATYSSAIGNGQYGCPSSHPILLPQLRLTIPYQTTAGPTTVLSSGNMSTIHADFMNGWDQAQLDFLVKTCLNTDTYCGGQDGPAHTQRTATQANATQTANSNTQANSSKTSVNVMNQNAQGTGTGSNHQGHEDSSGSHAETDSSIATGADTAGDIKPSNAISKTVDSAKDNPHITLIACLVGLLVVLLLMFRLGLFKRKPQKR